LLAAVTGARPAAIAAALTEREALGTTGFGGGCAIPHGRIPGCGRMHAAVLRLAKPIEWQAVDARPVDLLFALVGPDAPGAEHLKMLARISRALRERSLVAKLRGAADASALWALLAAPVVPTRSAA
jgi:PTS system nitrogen regulatory IIA component